MEHSSMDPLEELDLTGLPPEPLDDELPPEEALEGPLADFDPRGELDPPKPEKPKRKLSIAAPLAVLAACAALFFMLSGREKGPEPEKIYNLNGIAIEAEKADGDGVDAQSAFVLTSEQPLTVDEVRALVEVEPACEFDVKEESGVFHLAPKQYLSAGTVYNFVVASDGESRSWAFQTKNTFRLLSVSPTDKAKNVPPESGIEFVFSNADVAEIEKHIAITPALAGRFELHRNVWAFVPDAPMAPDTLYTVTVSPELATAAGEALGVGTTATFRTAKSSDAPRLDLSGSQVESFATDRAPVIEFYAGYDRNWNSMVKYFKDREFTVSVRRFADSGAYASALEAYHKYIYEDFNYDGGFAADAGLSTPYAELTTTLVSADFASPWRPVFLVMPEPLPAGWYAFDITCTDSVGQAHSWQKLIQVSDAAVYALSYEGGMSLWVNDSLGGGPAAGVKVLKNGYSVGVTDGAGVVGFKNPDAKQGEFTLLTVEFGATPYLFDLAAYEEADLLPAYQRYISTMYTDRSTYLPEDTISVWGFIAARKGELLKSTYTLKLENPYGWSISQVNGKAANPPIAAVQVTVDEFGCFTATLPIENLGSSYYRLVLCDDDEEIRSEYINIYEYTKPIYRMDVTHDKLFYRPGEVIDTSVGMEFYDGTPVKDYILRIGHRTSTASWDSVSEDVTTGADGFARHSFTLVDDQSTWRPIYISISITTAEPEDEQLWDYGYTYYLPRDVMVETDVEGETVKLSAHRIDTSKVAKGEDLYDTDLIRGVPIDVTATVKIYETTYTKYVDSSVYDPIEKVTRYTYGYTQDRVLAQTLEVPLVGGTGSFDASAYQPTEDKIYSVVASVTDTAGRTSQDEEEQLGENRFWRTFGGKTQYYIGAKDYELAVGETAKLNISGYGNGVSIEDFEQGRTMLFVFREGLIKTVAGQKNEAELTFNQSDTPNILVCAAYFDGKNIYDAGSLTLRYDTEASKLNVKLTPDKAAYAPGEEVALGVEVTDAEGKPTEAEVLLSVVDESALAISDNPAEPLEEIYAAVFWPSVTRHVSYVEHNFDGSMEGGEGGEGGGDGYRSDFRDNPAFETVKTDKNGKASVTFKLADSVTEWRITAAAVAEGLKAGTARLPVKATLPFFASVLYTDRYMVGDELSVALRGFGAGVTTADTCSFAAELTGEGVSETRTASAGGYGYAYMSFGKALKAGSYTLAVSAKCGELSDALKITFEVVEDVTEVTVTKQVIVSALSSIVPLRSPVLLTFTQDESAVYYAALAKLSAGSSGRTDRQVAAWAASNMLAKLMPERYTEAEAPELPASGGGVSLLRYSEASAETTAKVALAAPQLLNRTITASYFYNIIDYVDSAPGDVAAAYLGLAALKEPVLYDVKRLLAAPDGLDLKERYTLMAALSAVGDDGGAKAVYEELVAPKLKTEGAYVYVHEETRDDNVELTALALVTAARADPAAARGMARYLLDNAGSTVICDLELLAYLNRTAQPKGDDLTLKGTVDGGEVEVPLHRGVGYLSLTKRQLDTASFTLPQGVSVSATYADRPSGTAEGDFEVTKSVWSLYGGEVGQGGLAVVQIEVAAKGVPLDGIYEITETMPAGLRFVKLQTQYTGGQAVNWYLTGREGQKLTFALWINDPKGYTGTLPPIVYTARAVLPGQFILPPTTVSRSGGGDLSVSEQGIVTVVQ
ncbi:MAG TPA: Ig-like domain-containing protein [Terriglobales bacterium]|nr:Ig-like domain-containing protein [Terriglobales bacterium]